MAGGDVHVTPIADCREHRDARDCWCKPEQLADDASVFVHNAMDEREIYARGRKLQ